MLTGVPLSLLVALLSLATFAAIYVLYIMLVLRTTKLDEYVQQINSSLLKDLDGNDLPRVTVVVPAYNEERKIERKLQNLAELFYPKEKIEVLIVDDCSTDKTPKVSEDMLEKLGFHGRVIRSLKRRGANASYNEGVYHAGSDLVLRTDADIILESDALEKAVQIFSSFENIGGVTGTMEPISVETTAATGLETTYRTLFDNMSTAESALYSTFPGGGGFTLLRKSCLTPISTLYGSTDGNISLSILKKGFRYIYVPQTFSYEAIHHEFSKQIKQKVRRASRLIQSVIMNRDLLFNTKVKTFGKCIFPLRFAMIVICPTLAFISIISTISWLLSFSPIIAFMLTLSLILFTYMGVTKRVPYVSSIASFFVHQCYLLLGLLRARKPKTIWN